MILAECDLVFSRYLLAGSRGSLGLLGRWIWEEGNLSTSGLGMYSGVSPRLKRGGMEET